MNAHAGIPITLSLVYMEVGRRLGLTLVGCNFPGHFMLRLAGNEMQLFIDAFQVRANTVRSAHRCVCANVVNLCFLVISVCICVKYFCLVSNHMVWQMQYPNGLVPRC